MAEREEIVSPWETWSQLLKQIETNSDRILEQYESMKERYPDAAGALAITLAFVRYLGRTQVLNAKPVPDGAAPPITIPRFDAFCKRAPLICDCANGDTSACEALSPGGGGAGPLIKWTECKRLWEMYQQAKQRELELVLEAMRSGTAFKGGSLLLQLESESQRLRRALLEAGCVEFNLA